MSNIRYVSYNLVRIVRDFIILFLCLEAGTFISHWLPFKFSDSIIGLLILFILLNLQIVRLRWIEQGANILLKHMSLLFIPVAVGLLGYLDIFLQSIVVIAINIVAGMVLIPLIVGRLYQRMNQK